MGHNQIKGVPMQMTKSWNMYKTNRLNEIKKPSNILIKSIIDMNVKITKQEYLIIQHNQDKKVHKLR